MTDSLFLAAGRDALQISLLLAAPILGGGLVVGLIVGVLQALTQIQEMTLTFVPKVIVVVIVLVVFGPWMLSTAVSYAASIFAGLPELAR